MKLGDKVTVIKKPDNKTIEEGNSKNKYAKKCIKGILESISSNVIVIKYDNYRESFNIAEIIESRVEIRDKHHNKLTAEEFKKVVNYEKRLV